MRKSWLTFDVRGSCRTPGCTGGRVIGKYRPTYLKKWRRGGLRLSVRNSQCSFLVWEQWQDLASQTLMILR
ncbi:uncharacterized protein LACBIDRAFT_299088 [Laccaria bicolor S238N-H82]|uniref:Predicted protein n=1 Tax=Laccaria bicolor (strain S238N-H82 / ATCC MYA-4686) TaxID=486041 RepID=B0DE03_LACBS|nr:uncharacterized protein LACBIDRAFT_299088 [Laccaria bicolor S238N-H82]EDR07177.1 predicted protein [Laccaria bicolor S238N-H82]|eukprot:XP_001882108.1 predicted protein [Laccaria bicolor S238N-H82]